MKRLVLSFIVALAATVQVIAQNPISAYLASPDSLQLDCRFSYVIPGKVPVTGEGNVWMSGRCFKVSGNGITVMCDGVSRWTIDEESREVYAESADDMRDFLDNPSLLLLELQSVKYSSGTMTGVYHYDGQDIELTFSSIKVRPASKEKPFSPESEMKGYESRGYVVTDLR